MSNIKTPISTKSKALIAAMLVVAGIGVLAYTMIGKKAVSEEYIYSTDQRVLAKGQNLYVNNCASCHGAALEGQANWRERMPNGRLPAPPHDETGHTWHHPDAVLVDITKNGLVPGRTAPRGYVSDMPAYNGVLSDEDIVAVLAYIKSTWPAEAVKIQKEITMESLK